LNDESPRLGLFNLCAKAPAASRYRRDPPRLVFRDI